MRIKSVISPGRHFDPEPEIIKTANENGIFDAEIVDNVFVHCDDYLAKFISPRPLHTGQEIKEMSDGSCELRVKRMAKYRLITRVMHQFGRTTEYLPDVSSKKSQSLQKKSCVCTILRSRIGARGRR